LRKSSATPPSSKTDFRGQKSLFWHPTRTGKCPGAISIDSTAVSIESIAIFIDVAVSHDEEGVVLPWG
jgi:hypothetical protein